MLEHVPKPLGKALRGMRAGLDKLVSHGEAAATAPETITVTSPAFTDGAALPARFTEDGAKVSPPLVWRNLPPGAKGLVLIIEDPDAPTPEPLVHGIAWALPIDSDGVPEGAFAGPAGPGNGLSLGKNSFLAAEYLPPDPPTGHGPHRYVFQLFALDRPLTLSEEPGRGSVVEALRGHVLAKGLLTGTYERS